MFKNIYQNTGKYSTKGIEDLKNLKNPTLSALNNASFYTASKELKEAVNVAIYLGKPLLLTGEPGTGKTQLAFSLAYELFNDKPFVFTAKTTSLAKDLFYTYDHLQHFQDANTGSVPKEKEDIEKKYVKYQALGEAIKIAKEDKKRSVVLIDEIDKAPRDFPNDILREIEGLSFKVPEIDQEFKTDDKYKPIIVITSNAEKLLPDAFLRRCVYHHIDFPEKERLLEIIKKRFHFGTSDSLLRSFSEEQLNFILDHFQEIREICQKKKPATAEMLSWISILESKGLEWESTEEINRNHFIRNNRETLLISYCILVKNNNDLKELQERFFNE